jgi:hypothetical protein
VLLGNQAVGAPPNREDHRAYIQSGHVEEHPICDLLTHNEEHHHSSQTRAQSDRLTSSDQNHSLLDAAKHMGLGALNLRNLS